MNKYFFCRYNDVDPNLEKFKRTCKHNGPSYFCSNVTLRDIKFNKKTIYSTANKSEQEVKLCHLITSAPVQRKRPTKNTPRKRLINVSYHLKRYYDKKAVRVCQKFFMDSLGLSLRRINRVANVINTGAVPKENRGGDKKSHKSLKKKESIRNFIGNLRGKESHYNRSKSKRIYLGADLSITKLHKMYNSKCEETLKSSLSMFARVFRKDFNIGFSSPASDCCGMCMRLKHQMKHEKDPKKKSNAMLQYRMHTRRAKAFFELMRENPDSSRTFCFDLQQVQPLPRTPISDAFYAHQISYYAFCCVDITSRSPTFYTWCENLAGRGSVQIGSALLNYLESLNLDEIKVLRLFCDGCGGQNKNSHIIHALYYWLKTKAPPHVVEVKITYPVRGHSFLPADRVFGRVEKFLRKNPVVKTKEEYKTIYSNFGVVKELGIDWNLLDIKGLQATLKKIEGISDLKRIHLKKNLQKQTLKVSCYQNFRFEGLNEIPKILIKRGKTDKKLVLDIIPLANSIPDKKKPSLKHLLQEHFGSEWMEDPTLSWYKDLLCTELEAVAQADDEENDCDCLEMDHGAHV